VKTFEGAPAYRREMNGELFMLAVVNMVSEKTFYESAQARDSRYAQLCQSVALGDPEWMVAFIKWLRNTANMRSASMVAAAEMARAFQVEQYLTRGSISGDGGLSTSEPVIDHHARSPVRRAVDAACQRPDEPSEMVGYWLGKYGRTMPKALKRGLGDAARRLYNERSVLKYDTGSHAVRFGDVLSLAHARPVDGVKQEPKQECPTPDKARFATEEAAPKQTQKTTIPLRAYECVCGWWHLTRQTDALAVRRSPQPEQEVRRSSQNALFKYALDSRHGRDDSDLSQLPMIKANRSFRELVTYDPNVLLSDTIVASAGATWEDVLSLSGSTDLVKGRVWDAIIPSMGYMALLRNLRNFDEAGISRNRFEQVQDYLADPNRVATSRQFPYRFLSAYLNSHLRWHGALEEALGYACKNIPALGGRTLIMVDTSASMSNTAFSDRSKITPVMAAALFGVALTTRGEDVDLYGFADGIRPFKHAIRPGAAVLTETKEFCNRIGQDGHGTAIEVAIRKCFNNHDRVIVVTDMQTMGGRGWYGVGDVSSSVPADVPLYAFNLGGYEATPLDTRTPNRHELGGLNDATFKLIPLLEEGTNAGWPWKR
jgi:hypothetical protein